MLKKESLANSSKSWRLKEAIIFSICYLILQLVLSSFHEMWRDEIQAWSLTFNSHSISQLFHLTRYEGHGKLWFIIIYIIQLFSGYILCIQLIHVLIASLFIFVFYYFSPFKTIEKILFCFGYYFFFEYSVISRDYAIELLLLFLSIGIYLKYKTRYIFLNTVILFLLFQTNIYGIIMGFSIYCYMILNLLKSKSISIKKLLASALIIVLGLSIAICLFIQPADQGIARGWTDNFDPELFRDVITRIFTGYFPLPELKITFWNSNFTDPYKIHNEIQIVSSLLLIIYTTLIFKNNKKILLLFYTGTLGLLSFSYFKYLGYQRHYGQLFIMFIVCFWIFTSELKRESVLKPWFHYFRKYFLFLVLFFNLSASCVAVYYEINYPFSNANAAAEFLKSNSLDTMNISGDEYPVSSIAGLLNKKIYYPQSGRFGIYVLFDNKWGWLSTQEIIDESNNQFMPLNKSYILIFNYLIYPLPSNWQFLKSFENSIVGDENYYIYKVNPT